MKTLSQILWKLHQKLPGHWKFCDICQARNHTTAQLRDCWEIAAEAMIPADIRKEHAELTRPHRILPSGDVEFADEYGGY